MMFAFRVGRIKDKEQLRELALIAYSDFKKDMTKSNWDQFYKKLDAVDSYTNILKIAKCFVCEVNDRIIGVAYYVPSGHPNDIFEQGWSYLRMVGVHPDYRGLGIGKKLTQHCIAWARQSNEHIIALHTSECMDSARYMYEKLGFKQIKELNPLFGKKYFLYILKLN